jgi:hypothetical protein
LLSSVVGALLAFVNPRAVVAAVRATRNHSCDVCSL